MVDCGFDVGWSHLVAVDFSNWVPADVLDAAVWLCCGRFGAVEEADG